MSYVYDAGNLTQTTYPDGSTVDYTYDASNRLTTVTFGADTASYAYDASGKLTSFTHFNGVETTYTYDSANRLTGISSSVASYAFTLDAAGNRTHVLRNEPLECQLAQGSTVYEYNALKNRLLSAGTTPYAYDDEGQLTAAGTTALTFDDAHRLIGIGSGTQFTYDGAGKRLKAVRGGVETRYIYDPFGNLMAEADATGQITRKYIYGVGLLAMETAASGTFFYHFDATGHTIALTDLDQNIVNAYAYEPFGQILNQQETIAQPFKFVGRYGVLAEDGELYYMRARYYDSSTGRFISEDPLGFGGGDVNLSAYVKNDPVNLIDPYGLDPIDPRTGRANPVTRCHFCAHDDPGENAIGALLVGGPLVGIAAAEVYSGIQTYLLLQGATTASLLSNASQLFRNGPLTEAGRALTKHPNVVGECGNILQKLGGGAS